MAEFGIEASGMTEARAAGSTPHGGYDAPQMRTDAMVGLENKGSLFGQLAVGVGNLFKGDEVHPALKTLTEKLSAISSARESGSISQTEANQRARVANTQALASAGGDPELTKFIKQNVDAFFGTTSLGVEDEEVKFQQERDRAVISALQDQGFKVPTNPDRATMDSMWELYSKVQSSSAELKRNVDQLSFAASKFDYDQKTLKNSLSNHTNDFVSSTLPSATAAAGQTVIDLKNKVDKGEISAEEAIQTIRAQFDVIRGEYQQLYPTSPEFVSSTLAYLNSVESTMVDNLDPRVASSIAEGQLAAQMVTDRLFLSTDMNMRALMALTPYIGNNPFLFQPTSNITATALGRLVTSFNPSKMNNGVHLSDMSSSDRDFIFGAGKAAIKTAMGVLQDMQEGVSKVDPSVADNMVNNLLVAGANIPPEEKATVSKEFIAFLASDEFKIWRQRGNLSQDALKAAQDMFDHQYLKQVQQPILNTLAKKVPSFPSSKPWSGVDVPKENITFKDVLDVEFSGGVVTFSPRTLENLDALQMGRTSEFTNEVKKLQQAVNQLIVAGANVRGQSTDQYWKENKSFLLPEYFPPENPDLKVGDVVNGYKYKGGSVKSALSWEKVDGGGE